jgi:hypothetical protein
MRKFVVFLFLVGGSLFVFWGWNNLPDTRNLVLDFFHAGKFQTLEVHYTAEKIMDDHRKELLKDNEHSFLSPTLTFHPYLLMEVKYIHSEDETNENFVLWSLMDGEMVIDTETWETTRGFTDCIQARADRDDFKVINVLASHGSSLDREALLKHLNVEDELLNAWLTKCKAKNLIVQIGNNYRLHLQDPVLEVVPETKISHWLVTKNAKDTERVAKRFWPSEILAIAKASFGHDFTIRKTKEVFLPVYNIVVQNPDGSQLTTYWNALNGKQLSLSTQLE